MAIPNRAQPHGLGALFSSFFDGVACGDSLSDDEVPGPSAVSNLVVSDAAASSDVSFPGLDNSFAPTLGELLSALARSSDDCVVIHITANADPSSPTFVATRRGFDSMPPEAYQPPIREDTNTRSTRRETPRSSGGSALIRSLASLRRRVTPWGTGIKLRSHPTTDKRRDLPCHRTRAQDFQAR